MKNLREQHYSALLRLATLPERMVQRHECENLAELILHELVDPSCHLFEKAAFFVDNPDFDCCKGITGLARADRLQSDIMQTDHGTFSEHMRHNAFNKAVRNVTCHSGLKKGTPWPQRADELGKKISLQGHSWYVFPVKYGNTGVLLYQPHEHTEDMQEWLAMGAALLALCPVF